MSILETQGLTKQFGGLLAVNGLDFKIEPNSISSVIGPNGAGKTTFFNCITGFYAPEKGKIHFEGSPIHGLPPHLITRRGISRTYQNIRLFGNMSAMENILMGQYPRLKTNPVDALVHSRRFRTEERDSIEEARRLLNFIGLESLGDHLARNLPYGAQRRLEIARSLASQPKLLLLDEPTAGMNPQETDQLTAFIKNLRDDLGITILLIEHDMRVVMGISERITVLDYGLKIAEGTPAEIQKDHRVIEAYLGTGAASGLSTSARRSARSAR